MVFFFKFFNPRGLGGGGGGGGRGGGGARARKRGEGREGKGGGGGGGGGGVTNGPKVNHGHFLGRCVSCVIVSERRENQAVALTADLLQQVSHI